MPSAFTAFLPSDVPLYVWETPLDRILVGHCQQTDSQSYVYLRLIGPPDRGVNLVLVTPSDGGAIAEMRALDRPLILEDYQMASGEDDGFGDDDGIIKEAKLSEEDRGSEEGEHSLHLELFERQRAAYFADVYVLVRQLGLDIWKFDRTKDDTMRYGSQYWAYRIVLALSSADIFDLKTMRGESGLILSRRALISLEYASTSPDELKNSEVEVWKEKKERLKDQWQAFGVWRAELQQQWACKCEEDEAPQDMETGMFDMAMVAASIFVDED